MSFNPLQQFKVFPIIPLSVAGYDVSFTNSALFMVVAVALIFGFFFLSSRHANLVPGKFQNVAEIIFEFIEVTLLESAGHKGRAFFPFVFTLFIFILTLNLLGMMPYGFTVTSHIIVTFAIAALVFILVTVTGFIKHGVHFISLFLPKGTPIWLSPILFIIELLSFLSRPISLSIRLAGNMLAGHVLLKVLASFVVMMGGAGILPIPFMMIMVGFEIFVAILQAYIFTILTCVYLNDAINLH
jgi:F-type H+-transporting ATPase subunit a